MENKFEMDRSSLIEIIKLLWNSKITIISITSIFAILSVIYALLLPNIYRSGTVLQIQSDDSNAISSLSSQYGGIAALAGVSIPSSGADRSNYAVETIKSKDFLRYILENHDIKHKLIAVKSYDSELKKLNYDPDVYDGEKRVWARKPMKNRELIPSHLEIHEVVIMKDLSIQKDKMTGFISIQFKHHSPIFAKEFINLLVNNLNELTRAKDLKESELALEYLKSQLVTAENNEILKSINQMILAQLKTQMLANVRNDYLVKEIEPAYVPESRFSPSRSVICILGTLIGGLFSFLIVLIRFYLLKDNQ